MVNNLSQVLCHRSVRDQSFAIFLSCIHRKEFFTKFVKLYYKNPMHVVMKKQKLLLTHVLIHFDLGSTSYVRSIQREITLVVFSSFYNETPCSAEDKEVIVDCRFFTWKTSSFYNLASVLAKLIQLFSALYSVLKFNIKLIWSFLKWNYHLN